MSEQKTFFMNFFEINSLISCRINLEKNFLTFGILFFGSKFTKFGYVSVARFHITLKKYVG